MNMNDPQIHHVRSIVAGWMIDTVMRMKFLNRSFFEFFERICNDRSYLKKILVRGKKLCIKALTKKIDEILKEYDEGFDILQSRIDRLCEDVPDFEKMVREELRSILITLYNENPHYVSFVQARQRMSEFFGLDQNCQNICEALYILDRFESVSDYYRDLCQYSNIWYLGNMLGISGIDMYSSVDKLIICGFVYIHCGGIGLNSCVMQLWESEEINTSEMFGQPMEGECISLSEFNLKPELVAYAQKLMEQQDDSPVHILLYGEPGTGKTTFVRSLARAIGVRAWSVNSRDHGEDSERDRRYALMGCLNMAREGKKNGRVDFVVVDEAERMLDTNELFTNTKDKSWLNSLLERRGQRIVWITNKVRHIDPAVRRRFSLALHFEKLDFKQRCAVWQHVLDKVDAAEMLSQDDIKRLAQHYPTEAAIINDSVVQTRRLYPDREEFAKNVELLLESQDILQHDGSKKKNVKKAVNDFSLEGVCSKGSVYDLLDKCARVDAYMRDGGDIRPGCGTMLFYGAPGTGKTSLARYIADLVGRECVVKRASDLMSPWVGKTEHLIANAFRNAEQYGSVLVIDEVDSFIFSRDMANHSWETTMVNEFLTALEECRCFCVCTTNRREQLDEASMRRFAHKLEFVYANTVQAQALYDSLLATLCKTDMTEDEKNSLARLDCLSPGDFHTVRSQFDPLFVDKDKVSHKKLLLALAKEQEQKLDKEKKNLIHIGF